MVPLSGTIERIWISWDTNWERIKWRRCWGWCHFTVISHFQSTCDLHHTFGFWMIKIKRNCKEIEGRLFGARKSVKTGEKIVVCKISQPKRCLCEIGSDLLKPSDPIATNWKLQLRRLCHLRRLPEQRPKSWSNPFKRPPQTHQLHRTLPLLDHLFIFCLYILY